MFGRPGGEAGTGPVSGVFALAVVLAFLLLATQTLLHLTARSTVTAVAFDSAGAAAAHGAGCGPDVLERARRLLGAWGQDPRVEVGCERDARSTRVRLAGPSPARGLGLLPGGAQWLEVTAVVPTSTTERP